MRVSHVRSIAARSSERKSHACCNCRFYDLTKKDLMMLRELRRRGEGVDEGKAG